MKRGFSSFLTFFSRLRRVNEITNVYWQCKLGSGQLFRGKYLEFRGPGVAADAQLLPGGGRGGRFAEADANGRFIVREASGPAAGSNRRRGKSENSLVVAARSTIDRAAPSPGNACEI